MIDCPNGDVRDVLPDYVNERLAAHERAEVESHLSSCAACRDEVKLLRGLRATLRRAPAVNVDAIAAAIPPYRAPVKRGWGSGWRVAAALVAIAVGGTSIALLRDGSPSDEPAPSRQVALGTGTTPDSAAPRGTPVPETARRAPAPSSPIATPTRELAIAAGAIGELSDGELSALVEGLESLDALPSTEVEGGDVLPADALEEPS